jgi:ribonucleoside-diphosphate reductase alpha chain
MERFSNKIAIAPTASISIICGGTSAGIEPIPTNAYTHKTLSGSFLIRNPQLEHMLAERGRNDQETWTSIVQSEGSVQHLDCLTDHEKAVFKTAFELDQRWLVEHAADRAPYVCQSQSLNLFIPADIHKRDLHQIHFQAWKKGVKSLYYCRSKSIQRAEAGISPEYAAANSNRADARIPEADMEPRLPLAAAELAAVPSTTNYEECLACQ